MSQEGRCVCVLLGFWTPVLIASQENSSKPPCALAASSVSSPKGSTLLPFLPFLSHMSFFPPFCPVGLCNVWHSQISALHLCEGIGLFSKREIDDISTDRAEGLITAVHVSCHLILRASEVATIGTRLLSQIRKQV